MNVSLDFKNNDPNHYLDRVTIEISGPPHAVEETVAAIRASMKKTDEGYWEET